MRQGHLEDIDTRGQVGDVDAGGVLEYGDLLSGEGVHFDALRLHAEGERAGGRVGPDGEVVEVEVIHAERCKRLFRGLKVSGLVTALCDFCGACLGEVYGDVVNPLLADGVGVGDDVAEGDVPAVSGVCAEVNGVFDGHVVNAAVVEALDLDEGVGVRGVGHDTDGDAVGEFALSDGEGQGEFREAVHIGDFREREGSHAGHVEGVVSGAGVLSGDLRCGSALEVRGECPAVGDAVFEALLVGDGDAAGDGRGLEDGNVVDPVVADCGGVGGDIAEGDVLAVPGVCGETDGVRDGRGVVAVVVDVGDLDEGGLVVRVGHDADLESLCVLFLSDEEGDGEPAERLRVGDFGQREVSSAGHVEGVVAALCVVGAEGDLRSGGVVRLRDEVPAVGRDAGETGGVGGQVVEVLCVRYFNAAFKYWGRVVGGVGDIDGDVVDVLYAPLLGVAGCEDIAEGDVLGTVVAGVLSEIDHIVLHLGVGAVVEGGERREGGLVAEI